MKTIKKIYEGAKVLALVAWVLVILDFFTFGIVTMALDNNIGPSTQYHNPAVGVGTPTKAADGRIIPQIYVGEEFYVWIHIIRHQRNGNCTFAIKRYAEVVDGQRSGDRFLISTAVLWFQGKNELRRVRWPIEDDPYYIGDAIAHEEAGEHNAHVDYPYDDPGPKGKLIWPFNAKPTPDIKLLLDGLDEQEFTFYVVGRYFCNSLDYWFPRYIQGGDRPDITPRINAILKKAKS